MSTQFDISDGINIQNLITHPTINFNWDTWKKYLKVSSVLNRAKNCRLLTQDYGPYSRRWTKFSSGISLTSQTWFGSAFGLQAIFPAENTEYCKEECL